MRKRLDLAKKQGAKATDEHLKITLPGYVTNLVGQFDQSREEKADNVVLLHQGKEGHIPKREKEWDLESEASISELAGSQGEYRRA